MKYLGTILLMMYTSLIFLDVRYNVGEPLTYECLRDVEVLGSKVELVVDENFPEEPEPIEPVEVDEVIFEESLNGEEYLLAQIIHAEAKGESYDGKVAVGNVVLNRVNSEDFPDDIESVIFQRNQFSPVMDGSIYNEPEEESIQAAKDVLNGIKIVDSNALFFYNPRTSTSSWIFTRTTITDIGNHRFAY